MPLSLIENLALAAINLVGAAFSSKFSMKDALHHSITVLLLTAAVGLSPLLMSIIFLAETVNILKDPAKARPYDEKKEAPLAEAVIVELI